MQAMDKGAGVRIGQRHPFYVVEVRVFETCQKHPG